MNTKFPAFSSIYMWQFLKHHVLFECEMMHIEFILCCWSFSTLSHNKSTKCFNIWNINISVRNFHLFINKTSWRWWRRREMIFIMNIVDAFYISNFPNVKIKPCNILTYLLLKLFNIIRCHLWKFDFRRMQCFQAIECRAK